MADPSMAASTSTLPEDGSDEYLPRKVSNFACTSCQKKKRKCDGGRPQCRSCARSRSAVCVYKSTPSAVYVSTVERQLATLTRFVDHLVGADAVTRATLLDDVPADVAALLKSRARPAASKVKREEDSEQDLPLEEIGAPEGPKLTVDGHDSRGLHGPSSFFYLEPPSTDSPGGELDEAHAADNADRLQATIDSEYSSTMEWLGFLNVNSFMPEYRAGVFEAFLQLHWTWVQPFFGFVYRPAFMREMVTSTEGSSSYFSIFLLLSICGHAGRQSLGDFNRIEVNDLAGAFAGAGLNSDRPHMDNVFLRQARLLLFQEIEKDAQRQIPAIQGLLLLGAKECSGGKIGRAWMLTGMAIRMIQDLGIHLDGDDGDRLSSSMPAKKEAMEIRRRTFWTAFIFDKWISLYVGRTPMLQLSKRTPPAVFVDRSDDKEVWRPYGAACYDTYEPVPGYSTATFSAACSLAEIINLVLLFDAGEAEAANIKLAKVKLQEWRANVPSYLIVDVSNLPEVCPPAHIVSMNCTALMIALLIYRRSRRVPAPSRESIQVATDLTALVRMNFNAFGDRPAVLSHCYCMYMAATTLMQALKTRDANRWPTPEEAAIADDLSWLFERLSSAAASIPALLHPIAVLKEHLKSIAKLPTLPFQNMLFQAPVSTTAVSQEPFPPEIQPRAPPLQPPPFAASSSTYPFPDLSPGAQPTNGQRDGAGFPDAVFSAPPFAFGQEGRSNVEGNGLDALLRGMFDGSMQGSDPGNTPPVPLAPAAGALDDFGGLDFWHKGGGEFAVGSELGEDFTDSLHAAF